MKKNISILLIVSCILVISILILFAEEVKYDFRKTNWGMGREQVKATEDKKPDLESDTLVGYKMKISENDFLCVYNFIQDKLYSSKYIFVGTHTNKNDYIDDYENLKDTLIKKYGKPKIDKITWENDLYKDDKQD